MQCYTGVRGNSDRGVVGYGGVVLGTIPQL